MSRNRHGDDGLDRREFLRQAGGWVAGGLLTGSALLGAAGCAKKEGTSSGGSLIVPGKAPAGAAKADAGGLTKDLVLVKGGKDATADALVQKAFDELGGIEKLVRPGRKVCLKPNAAWGREPGSGANTHPDVLDAVIALLLDAGVAAQDISVFEHARDPFVSAMEWNGLGKVCKTLGVALVDGSVQKAYEAQPPAKGAKYPDKEELAFELIRADVVINLPVLKDHSATGLSMGMKNLMGAIYNPRRYHGSGDADKGGQELDERIADLVMLVKPKLTLTLLDATYVLRTDGPKGKIGDEGDNLNTIIVGTDPVAVDALGAQVYGKAPDKVGHVAVAAKRGLGEMDVDKLRASDRFSEVALAAAPGSEPAPKHEGPKGGTG